jgi:ketosteroid isomerase-like protein
MVGPRRANLVETYLDAIQSHDWAGLSECVAEDVVRVGPYGDVYKGRSDYIAFISDLLPTLPGYGMDVQRVTYDGNRAFAELSETVEVDGSPVITHEVLLLELEDDRIARINIFIQRAST